MVDIDKIKNREINVYVQTAHKIMQECLSQAQTRGSDNAYTELFGIICERYTSERLPDSRFLRNLNDKIKRELDPLDPKKLITIYLRNILPLAGIAGVTDYEAEEDKYTDSLSTPVFFTRKPWGFFPLIRVPKDGVLTQKHAEWEYNDEDTILYGNVIAVEKFTMFGDRMPFWVKVDFEDNREPSTVYFARHSNQKILPVRSGDVLLSFFEKMRDITAGMKDSGRDA